MVSLQNQATEHSRNRIRALFALRFPHTFYVLAAIREMPMDIFPENLTLPSRTANIGKIRYTVRTNAPPVSIDDLNQMPFMFANGAPTRLNDVAQVRDGALRQRNVVREHRHRSVPLSAINNANSSIVAVVNGVKHVPTANRARPYW